jgi:hypothetical protein
MVGLACLDIVNFVNKYPVEDSDSRSVYNNCVVNIYHKIEFAYEVASNYICNNFNFRCTNQTWARGGNASNNSTVLACLGQDVEYFGTLANDALLT